MSLIGTHQIGYSKPKESKINDLIFNGKIKFTDINLIYEKRFGHDKWILNLGQIFNKIISEIQKESSQNQFSINVNKMTVVSFKKGIFQWSDHAIKIKMEYEILDGQLKVLDKGEIIGQGRGSGKEFGGVTYIPVFGNINFDRGIEFAIYRCYENCLSKLYENFKKINSI